MKNLWPEKFEENSKPTAKSILEEQAKLLYKITNGIVDASIAEMEKIDAVFKDMDNEFAYRFDIYGKFLGGYRFNVLMFCHDITLYPVKFRLDEKIAAELSTQGSSFRTITIDTPEDLEPFLASVLRSERLQNVVGSIIRLSK